MNDGYYTCQNQSIKRTGILLEKHLIDSFVEVDTLEQGVCFYLYRHSINWECLPVNKKLEDYTKEELLIYALNLKKQKKFGLVWEEHKENVVKKCETHLPVIEEDHSRTIVRDNKPAHLIIEGDNYHALSILNYTHAGKIDVIYIDPPYNTGDQKWRYNNNYVDLNDDYMAQ